MRTATTALASLLALAMLAGGAMGAAAQAPVDDGGPTTVNIDITIGGAEEQVRVAVGDAGDGLTPMVPLTPEVMAELETLAIEFPYLAVHVGEPISPDVGRLAKLAEFADRFPYMAAAE